MGGGRSRKRRPAPGTEAEAEEPENRKDQLPILKIIGPYAEDCCAAWHVMGQVLQCIATVCI